MINVTIKTELCIDVIDVIATQPYDIRIIAKEMICDDVDDDTMMSRINVVSVTSCDEIIDRDDTSTFIECEIVIECNVDDAKKIVKHYDEVE